jgi:hypothetical protein
MEELIKKLQIFIQYGINVHKWVKFLNLLLKSSVKILTILSLSNKCNLMLDQSFFEKLIHFIITYFKSIKFEYYLLVLNF